MTIGAVVLLYIVAPITLTAWLICLVSHSQGYDEAKFSDLDASAGLYHPISPTKYVLSILIPVYLAYHGIKKRSLTVSGAVAALVIGWLMCLISYSFLISMLAFYLLASKATKFRLKEKSVFEKNAEEASARNWVQVLCNGGVATQLALFYYLDVGCVETPIDFEKLYSASWWSIGVLSALSCCAGDTFASELGPVLPLSQPYLITTFERVPKGTNGGVSVAGTLASALGGAVVGVAFYISTAVCVHSDLLLRSAPQLPVILVCSIAGLVGSMIDSLLGATVQYSGQETDGNMVERPGDGVTHVSGTAILDNHAVNLLSSALTSLIMPRIALYVWWSMYVSNPVSAS